MQVETAFGIGSLLTNAKKADETYSANAQIEKKRSGFEMALREKITTSDSYYKIEEKNHSVTV